MRFIHVLPALAALIAVPATAQGPGPKLGQLEVRAYQAIPKAKTAVQLTSDTHLSRNLRREVMVRLAQRGNEVGFSGGNVMRMDVTYIDLLGGGSGGGDYSAQRTIIPGGNSYDGPAANPRPDIPGVKIERRDSLPPVSSGPTLRITLTLYAVNTGKVLWFATASCLAQGPAAEQAGLSMIDNIFDEADKNRIADAGCPL
jgi:hypothetical protein